jgi:hypothetical protein
MKLLNKLIFKIDANWDQDQEQVHLNYNYVNFNLISLIYLFSQEKVQISTLRD